MCIFRIQHKLCSLLYKKYLIKKFRIDLGTPDWQDKREKEEAEKASQHASGRNRIWKKVTNGNKLHLK